MSTPVPGPANLGGLAIYTLFRGPVDQIVGWCNYHLSAGADRIYVVLDRPSAELVASLPDHPRVEWDVLDQADWDSLYPSTTQNVERKQVDAFRWTARRAAAAGHRHLAFVDADELLWLDEPFSELARAHADASAVTLPVSEMWLAAGAPVDGPFAATLALSPSRDNDLDLGRVFGWRAQFLRQGLLGHSVGKTVYRLPLAAGELSVHRPTAGALRAGHVTAARGAGRVLHYDCGDPTTWNAKWGGRLVGATNATGLAPQRQAQQQLFTHELHRTEPEQRRFFEEFYSVGEEGQALLAERGLLERVDARPLLAGPLVGPVGGTDGSRFVRLPERHRRVDFQFALVCDQRFVRPTYATMAAVLAQLGEHGAIRFVVLGDGLAPADVVRLESLEDLPYDVEVAVHDITSDLDRDVGTEDAKRATFGRIYLIDYLPEQRTVYLDGDVLPTRPFAELFDLDLGGACLAGVPDSAALRLLANPASVPIHQRNRLLGITHGQPLEYLNGGVLVFDLDNPDFRRLALEARSLVVRQGRALRQRDQDAMNIAFAGRKHRLPSTFNYMTQFYVSDRCVDGDLPQLKYAAADATLVHFSGRIKPWEAPDDEFYNGLYRRLVLATEEQLGISCGFYFSRPTPLPRQRWSSERWVEILSAGWGAASTPTPADVELVDVSDSGLHLRLSAAMLELARARGLRLVLRTHDAVLADVDLAQLGPPLTDLAERVGPGVRRLPLDLASALAGRGGVARDVEVCLVAGGADPAALSRCVAALDLVVAGEGAQPGRLADLGVDGCLEAVSDGWLVGWYDAGSRGPEDTVSLYLGDELAARRAPDLARPDLEADSPEQASQGQERVVGFRFRVAHLARLGYGHGTGPVTVRVSDANVPLRGAPVPRSVLAGSAEPDPATGAWTPAGTGRAAASSSAGTRARVRARVRRVVRRDS